MSESTGIPVRAVHEAHLKNLAAREAVASADNPAANGSHRALQRAVNLYFDTLRPYLTQSSDGREYYHGQAPDSPNGEGTAVLDTATFQQQYPLSAFQEPPSNANLEERHKYLLQQVPTDENEAAVNLEVDNENDMVTVQFVRFKTGLQHLEGLYSARNTTVQERTDWLPESDPVEEVSLELMDLNMLMRASRTLDEAAYELNFLPKEDDRQDNEFGV